MLRHELQQLPDQRIDVAVVVIEGVAVDTAVIGNVHHGYLIQRALLQQLEEPLHDALFRGLSHASPPFRRSLPEAAPSVVGAAAPLARW